MHWVTRPEEWDLLCREPSTSDVFQLPLIVYQAPSTISIPSFEP